MFGGGSELYWDMTDSAADVKAWTEAVLGLDCLRMISVIMRVRRLSWSWVSCQALTAKVRSVRSSLIWMVLVVRVDRMGSL